VLTAGAVAVAGGGVGGALSATSTSFNGLCFLFPEAFLLGVQARLSRDSFLFIEPFVRAAGLVDSMDVLGAGLDKDASGGAITSLVSDNLFCIRWLGGFPM
jgi:hypothetical protein